MRNRTVRKGLMCVFLLPGLLSVAMAQLPPVPRPSKPDSGDQPRLFVAQRSIDLGSVVEGEKVPVSWRLENHGQADLKIGRTTAGCGCTILESEEARRVIPPGGSLELRAEFDSTRRRGRQIKTVTVYSNDPAEPALKLEFRAEVEVLYEIAHGSLVNLRGVQRGQTVEKMIDIMPGAGRRTVELVRMEFIPWAPLTFDSETLRKGEAVGQRIRVTVGDDVPLGPFGLSLKLVLRIDEFEREHVLTIRGEVVGALTWLPKVVDATRQPSLPGKRLAPVIIRSTGSQSFEVLGASAGPLFNTTHEPINPANPRAGHRVFLTLRDDAPPGPFGETLRIKTNSLDQPFIEVPVFGIVAARIKMEPHLVLLRQDGTRTGAHRRVKLQAATAEPLEISNISCSLSAVTVAIDWEASSRYRHLRFLNVSLTGTLPQGTHEAVVTLTTNIEGARRLEIPVIIEVPAGSGASDAPAKKGNAGL